LENVIKIYADFTTALPASIRKDMDKLELMEKTWS